MADQKKFKLLPGDIACTRNPMALGRIINAVQKFYSQDNKSKYSHALIITTESGRTFEALWTVKEGSIFNYAEAVIYRNKSMSYTRFMHGYLNVLKHKKQIYPAWRLFFHIVPPMAKYISFNRLVCSELVGKFLKAASIPGFDYYNGLTPDEIDDKCRNGKGWKIIYEGKINGD